MLLHANLDSSAARTEDLSRRFFRDIMDPASCLHSLLPPDLHPDSRYHLKAQISQILPKLYTRTTATVPLYNMVLIITSKPTFLPLSISLSVLLLVTLLPLTHRPNLKFLTHYEDMKNGAKCRQWDSLGRLEVAQSHRQCHDSIERIRLPIRL